MDLPSTHASVFLPADRDGVFPADRLEALHRRYRDVILGWCRRRELSAECAEDVAQEIWLKLAREIHTFDPAKGRFRSWLKAVVNNAVVDYWRRQDRQPVRAGVGGSVFLERLANLAGPEASAELSVVIERQADNIATEVLARVRARLNESTWQSFYLSQVERRSAGEVAKKLGIGIASVYKNTYRVKQMLQEEYKHVHPDGQGIVLSERDDAEPISS